MDYTLSDKLFIIDAFKDDYYLLFYMYTIDLKKHFFIKLQLLHLKY